MFLLVKTNVREERQIVTSEKENKYNSPYNPGSVHECLITCKCGRF